MWVSAAEALGDALDLKDAETEGHSKRVTAFTIAIARAMGLPKEEISVIARGAFLHDVGKMAIPDRILRKPGPLTDDERTVMRTHSEVGYNMLIRIPFLREAAEIVLAQTALAHRGIARQDESRRYVPGPAMHVLSAQSLFGSGLIRRALGPPPRDQPVRQADRRRHGGRGVGPGIPDPGHDQGQGRGRRLPAAPAASRVVRSER